MWNTFFRDGGWGMYPVTVFGLALVAAGADAGTFDRAIPQVERTIASREP